MNGTHTIKQMCNIDKNPPHSGSDLGARKMWVVPGSY
jgi:hypothetical protein